MEFDMLGERRTPSMLQAIIKTKKTPHKRNRKVKYSDGSKTSYFFIDSNCYCEKEVNHSESFQ